MKEVILKGDERVVDTIIRENRMRVSRGQVEFVPANSTEDPATDTKEFDEADTKNVDPATDTKGKKTSKK